MGGALREGKAAWANGQGRPTRWASASANEGQASNFSEFHSAGPAPQVSAALSTQAPPATALPDAQAKGEPG